MKTVQAQAVTVERDGEIAVITMNRPEKRNALSLQMMRELDATLAAVAETPDARAILLRGEGAAFSARVTISASCPAARTMLTARSSMPASI